MNIRCLPAEYLKGVWEIATDGQVPLESEVLSFDLDEINVRKSRELEKYVNSKLQLISRYI